MKPAILRIGVTSVLLGVILGATREVAAKTAQEPGTFCNAAAAKVEKIALGGTSFQSDFSSYMNAAEKSLNDGEAVFATVSQSAEIAAAEVAANPKAAQATMGQASYKSFTAASSYRGCSSASTKAATVAKKFSGKWDLEEKQFLGLLAKCQGEDKNNNTSLAGPLEVKFKAKKALFFPRGADGEGFAANPFILGTTLKSVQHYTENKCDTATDGCALPLQSYCKGQEAKTRTIWNSLVNNGLKVGMIAAGAAGAGALLHNMLKGDGSKVDPEVVAKQSCEADTSMVYANGVCSAKDGTSVSDCSIGFIKDSTGACVLNRTGAGTNVSTLDDSGSVGAMNVGDPQNLDGSSADSAVLGDGSAGSSGSGGSLGSASGTSGGGSGGAASRSPAAENDGKVSANGAGSGGGGAGFGGMNGEGEKAVTSGNGVEEQLVRWRNPSSSTNRNSIQNRTRRKLGSQR